LKNELPAVLTIAGSDPSGGAGIQADLKTFHQFGVYGAAAITLLTVQNTRSVSRVEVLDPELVREQVEAVLSDLAPVAVKTGALGNAAVIEAVARLSLPRLVVDPVMISKHGAPLIAPEARESLIEKLLPRALAVTPNLPEAEALTGTRDPREAARRIQGMGARAVIIKGGHGGGHSNGDSIDLLLTGSEFHEFPGPRIPTVHTHGTGCSFSAALTALLARDWPLIDAVAGAKQWITEAIRTNPGLGSGCGPVNHFAPAPAAGPKPPVKPSKQSRDGRA
jgi:hydroxymethylpyrimidine/phosphomethylpyrimidine kinase